MKYDPITYGDVEDEKPVPPTRADWAFMAAMVLVMVIVALWLGPR